MKSSTYSIITCLLFICLLQGESKGQGNSNRDKSLIQFSGVVVSADSLQPIPFTSVIIRNARRGTITDFYGFFSFVAMKGDTLDFQYVGFKTNSFVIPDSLSDQHYSIIQVLVRDTINLKEAVIYPWPTKDEFKRAFVELKLSDDDLKRAQRNFELAAMKEVQAQVIFDGGLNYQMAVQQRQTQLYSQGQFRSISLLNPLAWAAFIQSWKDGAYKKKDKK
jgi:hypothetical protein